MNAVPHMIQAILGVLLCMLYPSAARPVAPWHTMFLNHVHDPQCTGATHMMIACRSGTLR